MAYSDLIEELLPHGVGVIPESEFLEILPDLLAYAISGPCATWTGDKLARLITSRFALGGTKKMTLAECGKEFGICRERVREVEGRALRHLRDPEVKKRYLVIRPRIDARWKSVG
ncbi:MAG: hypothetical protein IPN63_07595 [Gammaproteobacteria bacterium]|nr:hypothetical protein [Gammaproteobacteria bacterium]